MAFNLVLFQLVEILHEAVFYMPQAGSFIVDLVLLVPFDDYHFPRRSLSSGLRPVPFAFREEVPYARLQGGLVTLPFRENRSFIIMIPEVDRTPLCSVKLILPPPRG